MAQTSILCIKKNRSSTSIYVISNKMSTNAVNDCYIVEKFMYFSSYCRIYSL